MISKILKKKKHFLKGSKFITHITKPKTIKKI